MDIERLSKSQIVLLTLLVSFVTSIATGIVTVSLVNQAPPVVAQTVNRVIEKTIQQAVPSQAAAAGASQKTVIVNETDLFAKAIALVRPSVVGVYSLDATTGEKDSFLGLGLVVDGSGDVVADDAAFPDGGPIAITLADGTLVPVRESARDGSSGLAFLTLATSSSASLPTWKPVSLSTNPPVLGQNVIVLSGEGVTRIGNGLVATVTGPAGAHTHIDTTIPQSAISRGAPLITSDGTILGVSTSVSRTSSPTEFISSAAIKTLMTAAQGAGK